MRQGDLSGRGHLLDLSHQSRRLHLLDLSHQSQLGGDDFLRLSVPARLGAGDFARPAGRDIIGTNERGCVSEDMQGQNLPSHLDVFVHAPTRMAKIYAPGHD